VLRVIVDRPRRRGSLALCGALMIVAACGRPITSSQPSATNTTSASDASPLSTADAANGVAPAPTTLAPATTMHDTSTTVASSAQWSSEVIESLDSRIEGIDQLVFAPDGRAVAFAYLPSPCCADLRGWWRAVDGTWTAIDNVQEIFLSGAGHRGGPNHLIWANDRFIAIGTRGGVFDEPDSERAATWTSTHGADWTIDEDTPPQYDGRLIASLDGRLVAAQNQNDGSVIIRSTVDGRKWTDLGAVGNSETRSTIGPLDPYSLVAVPARGASKGGYVMTGSAGPSKAFVARSPDGVQWSVTGLDSLTGLNYPSALTSLMLGSDLLVYGTAYAEGSGEEEPTDAEQQDLDVLWRSIDVDAVAPTIVEGCPGGSLDSITLDPLGKLIWAVCSIIDVRARGDLDHATSQLMSSTDGVTFTPVVDVPAAWGAPSLDAFVSAIVVTNNAIGVAVSSPDRDGRQIVSLWTPSAA
jgi:hypothetical protein